jgi:PAS domain S-box-containing protein
MEQQQLSGHLFSGNSQAAKYLRSHPWHQTAFGPIETWSPSLKTAFSLLLNAQCPMFCIWGQDRIFFANDAAINYFRSGGYSVAMGQPIDESFKIGSNGQQSSALVHSIVMAVDQVFATGQPRQQATHRNGMQNGIPVAIGYAWSYSPIWDDLGEIGGVFATGYQNAIHDIQPEHPKAEFSTINPHLQLLANALPVLLVYVDRELRYRFANYTYTEWFGLQPEEVLGKHLEEVIGTEAYHALQPEIERVLEGETFSSERRIYFKAIGWRYVQRYFVPDIAANGEVKGYYALVSDVTEQRRTADSLRQREAEFQIITDALPVLVAFVDPQQRYQFNNQTYETWFGLTPETLRNQPIRDVLGEPAYSLIQPYVERALAGETVTFEQEIPFQHDGIRYIEATYVPRFDHQGKVEGFVALILDVSERKRSEAKRHQIETILREQRTILQAILRQAADAIMVCDASGQLTFVNPQARRLAQLDPDGKTLNIDFQAWGKAYDREGNPIPLENYCIVKALRGESSYAYESRMVREDGSYYDILISAAPLWNDQQQIMGAVATFMDISDRKQAEAALQASEERFRNLADNISQFAWMMDEQGWIFWYNKRWFDYTGTTLQEMEGWGWQAVHHPDHLERVVTRFKHCIETGEPWEDIFPLRGKDGTYRWFLSRALPIRDQQGNILRWFGTNTDITERKQAEENLAQREAELRLVTNAVPALISFVDAKQRYRFNNHRYEAWFGQSPGAIYGQHLRDVLGETVYEEIQPYVDQVLAGQEVTFESRWPHHQGGSRFVSATYVPRFTSQGTVSGFVALVSDISDRKQAEAALRQSEERLRMAQQAAGAGIWDWDIEHNQVTWSEEYYTLYGLDPAVTPSYEHWIGSIIEADREAVDQAARTALEQCENLNVEFRTLHPTHGLRWIAAIGQTFANEAGQPIRITGIALDISKQKRSQQALIESEMLAKTRAEELSAIMETTPAAIFLAHDPQCHHITGNHTAYEVTGTAPGSIMTATAADGSNPLPFKQCRNGESVPPDELPMQKAARTGQEVTSDLEFVFPDGTVRYIYGKAVPLFGPTNEVRGAIGGFVDITALKQSEQERERLLQRERQAREEAENASRIKDEFLAILSHELRSPLNPILGWTALLRQGHLDADKTATALETIERNAKLQIQLIDDLLDISRIIRGKLALEMAPTDLETTIHAAIETVRLAAEAKNIPIEARVNAPQVEVLGDAARLQQVFWNLLSNAVKFTPSGGQVMITLSVVEQAGTASAGRATAGNQAHYAQIQVTDTGRGISPDFLPHVFEYFRQADATTTRTFGGLGLGLAIVRYLVELHGGTVLADSPGEGQGATFTVRLPLHKQHPTMPASSQSSVLPLISSQQRLQGITILTVDDDPDTREFIAFSLEQLGARVVTTSSARGALQALQSSTFDVIISDIGMPEMDGYMMMRQLRQHGADQGGHTPAIALTAYAGEHDRDRALAAGFQHHIPKPVEFEDLINTILRLVPSTEAL